MIGLILKVVLCLIKFLVSVFDKERNEIIQVFT